MKEFLKDYQVFLDTFKNNMDNIINQIKNKNFINKDFIINLLTPFFTNYLIMLETLINGLYLRDHIVMEKELEFKKLNTKINNINTGITDKIKGYEKSFLYIEYRLKSIQAFFDHPVVHEIMNKLKEYNNKFRDKYNEKDYMIEGEIKIVEDDKNIYKKRKKKHLEVITREEKEEDKEKN